MFPPALLAFLLLTCLSCGGSSTSSTELTATAPTSSPVEWVLTWSDEFNTGSTPDSTKWQFETGGGGFGNNELEYHTARPQNSFLENGNLVIEARKETFTGPDNVTRQYTSARLKTATLFEQAYGKFEARIKMTAGQGIWPAFWLLGNDIGSVSWPACGEIDIMENVGKEPAIVHGSLHGPGFNGGGALTGSYTLPTGKFADDFHVFAVEWEPNAIRFYVDGSLYETRTKADVPAGGKWPFDHPFFVILNVAVGGNWPGNPDATTVFPQRMLVDYVRAYSAKKS